MVHCDPIPADPQQAALDSIYYKELKHICQELSYRVKLFVALAVTPCRSEPIRYIIRWFIAGKFSIGILLFSRGKPTQQPRQQSIKTGHLRMRWPFFDGLFVAVATYNVFL